MPLPAEIPAARYEFYRTGDGARLRYAIFDPEGPPRGTFLVTQGRREFVEKKYLEVGRDLLARGYRVIHFDWRGQGGSSRYLGGHGRQHDHLPNFQTAIDDMRGFYRDVVKPHCSGPLVLFCHSMGALLAIRWLAETPADLADVKGLIATASAFMINVPPLSLPISRLMVKLGKGERYAGGQHDYSLADRRFERNMLSHDQTRFGVIEKYFDGNPDLKVGGVTWSWLVVALEAMKQLQQPNYLERISKPVLALFGTKDFVTPPAKIIPLIRRMPQAEIVTICGAWHDLMNESDLYRDQAWRQIDRFLHEIIRG